MCAPAASLAPVLTGPLYCPQVLRYGHGQYYKKHYDSLDNEEAGPRVVTVLMYLRGARLAAACASCCRVKCCEACCQ